MPVRTDQLQRLAVQNESPLGVERERADSERIGHAVQHAAVGADQLRADAVQIRIVGSPQPGRVERHGPGRNGLLLLQLLGYGSHAPSVGIEHRVAQRNSPHTLRQAEIGADLDRSAPGRNVRGTQIYAGSGTQHVEVRRIGADQLHVTVNTAVKREIGRERRNLLVIRVVDADGDPVRGTDTKQLGHVVSERRIPPYMRLARAAAVHPHGGDRVGRPEREEYPATLDERVDRQVAHVPARPPVPAVRLVLDVGHVPRMGQIDRFPAGDIVPELLGSGTFALEEFPVFVDRVAEPGSGKRGAGRKEQAGEHQHLFHRISG